MSITLTEAAKEVGITKSGLMKAIRKGKLSAAKDVHGEWTVDPSELFRVYPKSSDSTKDQSGRVVIGNSIETNGLRREIELQREQINNLRDQLSQSSEEKGKILKMMDEQITNMRMLTDQRRENKAEEGRGLWKRIFG